MNYKINQDEIDRVIDILRAKGFLKSCSELIYCKGFRKFIGLMFTKPKCAIIDLGRITTPSMHNLFVFYSLKLLFFDEDIRLVGEGFLKPFRFFRATKKARFVLEIPIKFKISIK